MADGSPLDDKMRIGPATREGLAAGSRDGHAIGVRRGLMIAEPILIVGVAVILVLWLAHALLGMNVRVGVAQLGGGGVGALVGGAVIQGLRSARGRRTEESPDEDEDD
jgi:hypothetical protein